MEIQREKRKYDLLSMGEMLMRLSPPGNERLVCSDILEKKTGGAELNVSAGAALLGLKTGIISKLPSNALGLYIRNQVRFNGVSDEFIVYDTDLDARLGLYYYESGAHPRKPGVVYDRKNSSFCKISADEFPAEMFVAARCFHTSGITLALGEGPRKAAVEMIRRFKAAGAVISFDVNFRANLWTGAEAKKCIEQILPYVDIFFCSEDTARLTFLKEGSVTQIMESFSKDYPISVVASTQRIVHSPKRHTFGSVAYDAGKKQFYQEAAYENIDVVDRIGSGDSYVAGFLYGLLAHSFDCEKAVAYGNAYGAVKNTIPGDLPSCSLDEIGQMIKNHNAKGRQPEMNR